MHIWPRSVFIQPIRFTTARSPSALVTSRRVPRLLTYYGRQSTCSNVFMHMGACVSIVFRNVLVNRCVFWMPSSDSTELPCLHLQPCMCVHAPHACNTDIVPCMVLRQHTHMITVHDGASSGLEIAFIHADTAACHIGTQADEIRVRFDGMYLCCSPLFC